MKISTLLRAAGASLAAAGALSASLLLPTTAATAAPRTAAPARITGGDASWPQCPKGMGIPSRRSEGKPMPGGSFVILGLTNGPGFYPNPCLTAKVAWAKAAHKYTAAYALTTYPTTAQLNRYGGSGPFRGDRLRNAGYAEAQFNVAAMRAAGLATPVVWVDVEPYRVAPWSNSVRANRAVVDGVLAGYRSAGYAVGIYSTPGLWRGIVGSARYNLPEWRAAGNTGLSGALRVCGGTSIQGGRAVLGQWAPGQYDFDVVCPAYTSAWTMAHYFNRN